MNRTLAEGPEADFIKQMDNPVCVDTGTDFFSLHEDFNLAGFTCRGVGSLVFGLIVIFLIQVFSNQLWTKIGQLERVALTFPAHSAKRASTPPREPSAADPAPRPARSPTLPQHV